MFQFLNKADFPSKEDLQTRNWKEARKEEDNKLRKEFGIIKDVRVHLTRISTSELTKDSDKASTFKWKVTIRNHQNREIEKSVKGHFCPYT